MIKINLTNEIYPRRNKDKTIGQLFPQGKTETLFNTRKRIFTVDRKTWIRGTNSSGSMLFNRETNKKCCVGFFCNQILKLEDGSISGHAHLKSLSGDNRPHNAAEFDTDIYHINDDAWIPDDLREEKLKKAFAKLGYEIRFKG